MAIGDYAPWKWGKKVFPMNREEGHPFDVLQRQMQGLFEDFVSGFGYEAVGGKNFSPRVNVSESDEALMVSAELPGMDEKDVEVTLTKEALTLRGEKKSEEEHRSKAGSHVETCYGFFQRVIPLTSEIDEDKVDAEFKKGVLRITLPKTKAAREGAKRISIRQQ